MDEKRVWTIVAAVALVGVAPLVTLLGPALMVGLGSMESTFDFLTFEHRAYGFGGAFGKAIAAAYTTWHIALVYGAAVVAIGLRLRAPLGGGNAAGSTVLLGLAGAFNVAAAFTRAEGIEAFGATLFAFFLCLPGAIAVAIGIASWGRRFIATDEHVAAQQAKHAEAEQGYL